MALKKPNIVIYLSDDHSWVEKAKTDPQTAQLIYLTQHHPVEELYDVTRDPYEFDNLAFSPEIRPIFEEMRADVQHWMHAQNDEGRREHAT